MPYPHNVLLPSRLPKVMSIENFLDFSPQIHPSAYIASQACVIGQVVIGAHSSVWPACVLRGDVESITIGQRTNIQDGSILHVTHDGPFSPGGQGLIIGNDVTVGHGAILHACTIGSSCLIGMGAIVLDGAVIEENAMVGAGSVVSPGKVVPSGSLWVGNPARQVRMLSEKEIEQFDYSAQSYVSLMQQYLSAE
ncbi:MAG: gamma carbonic anhydrase family protein [bacterium]